MMNLLVPSLVVIPFVVGLGLLIARRRGLSERIGEAIGVATAVLLVLLTLCLYPAIGSSSLAADQALVIAPSLQFAPSWLSLHMPAVMGLNETGWQLSLGVDGIGFMMVLLTAIVTLAVILVSRTTISRDRSDFGAWILFATSGLMLAFTAMDLVLFYVGFELALIPLYPLIAQWGEKDASAAAKRFVLYTLAGSIPMILGLLGIAQLYADDAGWTVSLPELSQRAAAAASNVELLRPQRWIFAVLLLGLGIKMALMPLHTWLPSTYGACHATAGAFMAAVVLKLGLFGFIRLALPMVPQACEMYGPTVMGSLGTTAIVAGALMALAQSDLRRLLAYSSLSHVGFVTLGLFALNEEGISGGVLQMFNHGITTAAVFLAASCVIARCGTSKLSEKHQGIASRYPKLGFFMIFFLAAGAGVPGLNNFVGETLTLTGMFARQPVIAGLGTLGIVLGAWYAFRLIQTLLFGESDHERSHDVVGSKAIGDIGVREKSVFGGLAVLCLGIGIYPQLALNLFRHDARSLGQNVVQAEQNVTAILLVERKP
jgi:NADH-quinone oxidoreductase subunit M